MDQLHLLFLLSFSMLIGSFFSGIVPMAFKLSDSRSRLLALMGSGILVGTALSIIIPEGINSIYSQRDPVIVTHISIHTEALETEKNIPDIRGQEEPPVQAWVIGVSLVAGFILMLFIDQFSLYQNSTGEQKLGNDTSHHEYTLADQEDNDLDIIYREDITTEGTTTTPESISDIKTLRINQAESSHRLSMRCTGVEGVNESDQTLAYKQPNNNNGTRNNTKVTPTLGLVIHAAADGIALGAAATTSHRQVEMIIFLAIMLHKGPAAFSLVVFLLHRGLKHSTIRRHLMAFSLSAPLAALLTYFGLSQSGKEALRRNNATGIAMLFSAGTFLYVATVHVLPELVHNRLLTPKELVFLVGGAFLPVLLAQTI